MRATGVDSDGLAKSACGRGHWRACVFRGLGHVMVWAAAAGLMSGAGPATRSMGSGAAGSVGSGTTRPASRPSTRAVTRPSTPVPPSRELLERWKGLDGRRAEAVKLAREVTKETLPEVRRNFRELLEETAKFNAELAPIAERSPLRYPSKMPEGPVIGKAVWLYKAGKAVAAYNESKKGEMSEDEYGVFGEVNRYREALGLVPVEYDVRLRDSARGHSKWMNESGQFDHEEDRPGSKTFSQRIKNEGYDWMGAAENIAEGHPDAHAVFEGWFESPGHHHNLVGDYTHMGVGKVDKYWTQNFGKGEPPKAKS